MALRFDITGDNSNFLASLDSAREGVHKAAQDIEQSGMGIEEMFKRIGAAAGIAFSLDQAKNFAKSVMYMRGQFQQLEIAFSTMLQSEEKASMLMSQLVDTAAKTPFDLQGVAQGAKQLLAYGIAADEVNETITRLGDIAAGLSIPLGDLVYLYGTTMTQGRMFTMDLRQFMGRGIPMAEELAKQFGVTKNEVAGLVTAGQVGADAVKKAIWSMTDEGSKFGGLMSKQSASITGQISNIEDAIDSMLNDIGKKSEGIINGSLSVVSSLIENYEKIGKTILTIVSVYGAYKAAVMSYIAVQKVHKAWLALEQTAHLQNVLATEAEIAAKGKATVATVLFDKANKALNSTMLANPYVLMGMAIIGLSTALYKATTAANDFDEAQSRLNDQVKENEASVTEELNKLDALNRQLLESEKGSYEYKEAKQAIISQYGQYFKGLDAEIEKVGNITGAYDKLTESIRRSIGARNLKSFYDKEMDNYDKKVSSKLDKAYSSLIDKYGEEEGQRLYHKLYSATVLRNKSALSLDDVKKLQKTTFWDVRWGKNAKDGIVDFRASVDDLREDIYDAKAASDKALKEYKDMYEITDEEWNNILYSKGTVNTNHFPTTSPKKTLHKKTTKDDKEERTARAKEEELKYQEELLNIIQQGADAMEEARIAAIEDEAEREREERKSQHEKTLREIEDQEDEIYKVIYEQRKKAYETANKGKHYENTEAGTKGWGADVMFGTLNDSEKNYYNLRNKIIIAERDKENAEYNRYLKQRQAIDSQAYRDFLKEYGTYEQQRLAIAEEYQEKINKATSPAERAVLTLKRDDDLEKLGQEDLLSSIDWNGVFSDLKGHTVEYLAGLRDQLQTLLSSGEITDLEQLQTVQEKIQEINGTINEQGTSWQFIGDRAREYARLLQQEADAKERLVQAQKQENDAQSNVSAIQSDIRSVLSENGLDADLDIDSDLASQFEEGSDAQKTMIKLLSQLWVAEGKLEQARKKTKKATQDAAQAEDATKRDGAQEVADWFADAQQFIAEKGIDQIPELFNQIGLGNVGDKLGKGLDGFNDVAGAAADFASGNFIGAAVKGISALKNFGSALGIGGGNAEEVQKTLEKLSHKNELLTEAIETLTQTIGNSAGLKAISAADEALKLQAEKEENLRGKVNAQMGYHDAHHSFNYYWGGLSADELEKVNNTLHIISNEAEDWSGDLSELTAEQAKALLANSNIVQKIENTGKGDYGGRVLEYIRELAEEAGRAEEITRQINDNLTQTSFDSMRGSFIDTLTDMESDSEDFANNLEDIMYKAFINSMVLDDEFDAWLKQWQEEYAKAVKEGDAARAEELRKAAEERRNIEVEEAEMWKEALHYDPSNRREQQSASANSISNISYDQADALVGILLGHTVIHEQGNMTRDLILQNVQAMHTGFGNTFNELRTLTIQANSTRETMLKIMKEKYESFDNKLTYIYKELQAQG